MTADRLGTIAAEMRSHADAAEHRRGRVSWRKAREWAEQIDAIAALTPAAGAKDDELLDAAEAMLRWLVKNVDRWHFPQYDDLHRACANRRASPAPPPAGYTLAQIRTAWEAGAPGSMRTWDELAAALSAPPPADAVRALVGKWRAESFARAVCADELESALSAAPAGEGLPTEADFARIASSLAAQQEPSLPITSDMLADMLDPPAAAPTPEGLRAKVKLARFGHATIEVDTDYYGPHMIGDGDRVVIFVEQKNTQQEGGR